jgi:STAS-like domain of unknown function (DUF4325)
MPKEKHIDFVKEFTDCPGGRLKIHGDHSGEEFRDSILKPALEAHDAVILHMDGAVGFPSSFIDEVFGTLSDQFGAEALTKKLKIDLNDDPIAFAEIKNCILARSA